MINWILGSIIFGAAIFIIVRTVIKMRKGQSCCCEGCGQASCCSKAKGK